MDTVPIKRSDQITVLGSRFGKPAAGEVDIFGIFIHQGIVDLPREKIPAQQTQQHAAHPRADLNDIEVFHGQAGFHVAKNTAVEGTVVHTLLGEQIMRKGIIHVRLPALKGIHECFPTIAPRLTPDGMRPVL